VEFNEWHGRTVRWWNRPLDVKNTAPLRARASGDIRQVIEQDSWRLALEGIGAAERALHRVGWRRDLACAPGGKNSGKNGGRNA